MHRPTANNAGACASGKAKGSDTKAPANIRLKSTGVCKGLAGSRWCSRCQRRNGSMPCSAKRCNRYSSRVQATKPAGIIGSHDAALFPDDRSQTVVIATAATAGIIVEYGYLIFTESIRPPFILPLRTVPARRHMSHPPPHDRLQQKLCLQTEGARRRPPLRCLA